MGQPQQKTPGRRRRPLLEVAAAVAVVALATSGVPALLQLAQPADYSDQVAGGWSWRMTRRPAEVLLLGNSLVNWGVDPEIFESLTHRPTAVLRAGNSAGAWWYLVLDRFVTATEPLPRLVVLCFPNDALTMTSLSSGGQVIDSVDRWLDRNDRRLRDRIVDSSYSAAMVALDRSWPLIAVRTEVRRQVEAAVRGYVATVTGRPPEEVDANLQQTFDLSRKDAEVLDRARPDRGEDLRRFDFEWIRDRSFLPDILGVADRHHLKMVFVRMPRRPIPGREPGAPREVALERYSRDLAAYLAQRGYPMLDLSELPGLVVDDFAVGDHLNEKGRAIFTPVLAAALDPYLPPAAGGPPRRPAMSVAGVP